MAHKNVRDPKKHAGYSMLEILVATAVVVIVTYAVAYSVLSVKKAQTNTRSVGSCHEYLDAAFANFERYGAAGSIQALGTATPITPVSTYALPAGNSGNPIGPLLSSSLFPLAGAQLINFYTGQNSASVWIARTPALFMGSMTIMNALYNQFYTNICAYPVPTNYPTLSGYLALNNTTANTLVSFTGPPVTGSTVPMPSVLPSPPPDLNADGNFEVDLAMTPYNLTTAQAEACGAGGAPPADPAFSFYNIPQPLGLQADVWPIGSQAMAQTPPVVSNGLRIWNYRAFILTIGAKFTSQDQKTASAGTDYKTCMESRVMAYPAITTPPNVPAVWSVNTDSVANSSLTAWGINPPQGYTINIAYNGSPGTVLMCQDTSIGLAAFEDEGAPYPWAGAQDNSKNYKSNTNTWPTLIPSPNSGAWVPCDQATVCGKPLTSYSVGALFDGAGNLCTSGSPMSAITNSGQFCLQLNWYGNAAGTGELPYGCNVNLNVYAVDPAGNLSQFTNTPPATGPAPVKFVDYIMDPYAITVPPKDCQMTTATMAPARPCSLQTTANPANGAAQSIGYGSCRPGLIPVAPATMCSAQCGAAGNYNPLTVNCTPTSPACTSTCSGPTAKTCTASCSDGTTCVSITGKYSPDQMNCLPNWPVSSKFVAGSCVPGSPAVQGQTHIYTACVHK